MKIESRNQPIGGVGSVAATAATATAIAAATTAVAATTTTTATGAGFSGLGFVDGQPTTTVFVIVQAFNCGLRFVFGVHLDEAEAFASTRVAILDHLGALDRAEMSEEGFERRIVNLVAQIADVELL